MTKLIINADDFGLSKGVNLGILHAYQKGVVNSASLMTTTPYFEEAVNLIEEHRLENIGLHFNLTEGVPALTNHKYLCAKDNFFQRNVHLLNDLNLNEVFSELEAQYLRAIKLGVKINHFDSHHHVHMTSSLRKVFVALSKKYSLPLRRFKNTSRHPLKIWSFYQDVKGVEFFTKDFSAEFYADSATKENLLLILKKYGGMDLEIMCHPGYIDSENGIYNEQRENELKILSSEEVIQQIKEIQ